MSLKIVEGNLVIRWRNGSHRQATFTEEELLDLIGRAHTPTIAELALDWWKANEGGLAPNTRKLYDWLMGFVIQLGDVEAGRLTPAMVEDWNRSLDTGAVAKGKAQTLLGQILKRAVKAQVIPANPVDLADRPKIPKAPPIKVPSVESVEALRAKANPRDSMAIGLMAYAALAPVDAFSVAWTDWRGGVLSGQRQKSGERFHIPLHRVTPTVAQQLDSYRDMSSRIYGPIVGPQNVSSWRRHVWYAKLDAGFNPYLCRHLGISLWLRDPDVTDLEAAEWAGHSRKMQDRYGHIVGEGPQAAEEAIRKEAISG